MPKHKLSKNLSSTDPRGTQLITITNKPRPINVRLFFTLNTDKNLPLATLSPTLAIHVYSRFHIRYTCLQKSTTDGWLKQPRHQREFYAVHGRSTVQVRSLWVKIDSSHFIPPSYFATFNSHTTLKCSKLSTCCEVLSTGLSGF